MIEKMRTVRLYGVLGSKFGRTHRLAVRTPAEAVRALGILLPGFETYMRQSKDKGLTFAVFVGKENITKDQLQHPTGDAEIRIAPIIIGSKKQGIFQTIVGIILIVVGAVMNYFAPGSGVNVMGMGVAMVVGGVVQMLSPQPKGLGSKDQGDSISSYSFNGPVNTQAQGNPVPVLYGRLIVGSAVVSAGIRAEDIYVPYNPCAGYRPSSGGSGAFAVIRQIAANAGRQCLPTQGGGEPTPEPDPTTGSYFNSGSGGFGWTGYQSEFEPVGDTTPDV